MKKILYILSCALLALIVFVPLCAAVCAIFGYKFSLVNPWLIANIIFVMTAATVLVSVIYREKIEHKIFSAVLALLTPCALINTAFYVRSCGTMWLVASLLICVGCGYLTFRHGAPVTLRAGALVLTAGLMIPMLLVCFVLNVAGKTQNYIILETVDSPSGAYYAQVINNDQGEKGGSMLVHIYADKGVENAVFTIKTKRIQIYEDIYSPEDADTKTVVVQWKNDRHLVINGKDYSF